MKRLIFGVALGMAAAANAQPAPRDPAPATSETETRVVLQERMAQRQLDMLIAQITDDDKAPQPAANRVADARPTR